MTSDYIFYFVEFKTYVDYRDVAIDVHCESHNGVIVYRNF